VTALPIDPSATWGGGNPTELPCMQTCHGDPVNTATGDYYETVTDLELPGRGPALEMTRTYSSLAADAGKFSPLGRGWVSSYGLSLKVDSKTGVVTITNSNGSQTVFDPGEGGAYTAPPRVLADLVHNEDGTWTYTVREHTIYTFDGAGKLKKISDLNGNDISLSYNEAGRLSTVTDDAGRSLIFSYENSRLTKVADSTGRSVSYGHAGTADLISVTDVRGKVTSYFYNGSGDMLTREDPRGNTVLTNAYDPGGRVTRQTDGLGQKTTFSYKWQGSGLTTEVTDPSGDITRYVYAGGALASKTEAVGTASQATWTYERDPNTNGITAITDPNNHTSYATYDSHGNKTSTKDALGNETSAVYDSLDNLLEFTDAEGTTTTYEYDERGNLLSSSTPLAGAEPAQARTVTYAREDEAHPEDVTAITDPNGHTTNFTYNATGDLTSVTDAAGNETTYTYNERGFRLTQVSPRGNVEGAKPSEYTTTFTYDADGHRLTATDPLGHERKWAYDDDGNLREATNAKGHTTTYTYDVSNRPIKVERPNGNTRETAYDVDGNVASQTDGLGRTTTYARDPLGRPSTSTDPLGRKTEYTYDGVGNLKSKKDPEGRTTTYAYDAADQLTKVTYSSGLTPTVEYGYDGNGRRTSMTDGSGETTYDFDSLGRLTATTNGHGDTIEYGYDLAGNKTSVTYPNGKTVSRGFDTAGRLTSVTDWLGNTTSFSYDANSNLLSSTFPKGTGNIDEFAYDHADAMSQIQMKRGSESLASLSYVRDKANQLESLTSKGLPGAETEAFSYDENNRLVKAGAETFKYDAADNLTESAGSTSTYDAAHQLSNRASVAYGYNGLGQRTSEGPPPATFLSSTGTTGTGGGQFYQPSGVAIDSKGNAWVLDWGNQRVEKFNSAGEYQFSFGSNGTKNRQLYNPSGIAIDGEDHIWVVDWANGGRVQEFTEAGKYMTSFGKGGSGNGEFNLPQAITFDSKGNIWVADCCSGHIQQFTNKGKFIKKIGTHGTAEGQIWSPLGIAFDAGGDLWIADFGNKRIEEFTAEGKFLQQFGTQGTGDGEFKGPGALMIDKEGNIWVVDDEGNDRVQKFSQTGQFLGKFGSSGSGEGQFKFDIPMGIAVDAKGVIWVVDGENNRVQRWQMGSGKSGTNYSYDQAGNLTAVKRSASGETPAIDESYAYDGAGLRVSQTVSGTKSQLTWDVAGGLPLLLADGSTSYIYGPGGMPIEQISGTTPTYYHPDQLGSTRMLTNASGEKTATFSYGAYGALTGRTGTQTTPLGYAGQYTNKSGLQYLRARVYDPATGQFLTRDPLESMTHQPYTYAGGNPLNRSDPTGAYYEESEEVCIWPFCPPPAPAVETLEKGLEEANEAIDDLWNSIFGDDDSDTGPAPGQCPLEPPAAVPNFDNPAIPPGPEWEWRGSGEAGSSQGSWYNPDTDEALHPDLEHPAPYGPHYDLETPDGDYRIYPDGSVEPK